MKRKWKKLKEKRKKRNEKNRQEKRREKGNLLGIGSALLLGKCVNAILDLLEEVRGLESGDFQRHC